MSMDYENSQNDVSGHHIRNKSFNINKAMLKDKVKKDISI